MIKENIGIYIHIPFCKSKCHYCDFISYSGKENLQEAYIDTLIKEIENANLKQYNIKTIYIGGGTPSILDSKCIQIIIQKILQNTKKSIVGAPLEGIPMIQTPLYLYPKEITIEVNPGTVNEEKLKDYYDVGINRLSIGLQSADDKLLKQIRKDTYFRRI